MNSIEDSSFGVTLVLLAFLAGLITIDIIFVMIFGRYNCNSQRGGWTYKDPLGAEFYFRSFLELIPLVFKHREKNGGDLSPGWQHRLGDDFCSQQPECKSCKKDSVPLKRALSFGDVNNFLKTATKWLSKGGGFVSEEEAIKRAKICEQCEFNVKIEACETCHKLVGALINKSKDIPEDIQVDGCYQCGCMIKAKVWIDKDVMSGTLDKSALPSHCWMR